MKYWTALLRALLARALRDDAHLFAVTEKHRDGVLVVRPTQDEIGIGQRLVVEGVLPADAPEGEYELLFEIEREDDPLNECRYFHIRARAGRRHAPFDAKLSVGWPLRNTDTIVWVLRRGLREMLEAARAARALAASDECGLVDGIRRRP